MATNRHPQAGRTLQPTDGVLQTTLATPFSGVRVVTETMPSVRSVTAGFWLGCGSRDERAPVAGASHFLEHLLFKGTKRRTAVEIAEALDAVGGDMNAFTSKEYTCFYARCLDRDLPLAVDVLADMVTSARVSSADVDAERDVVLEEIRMHLDTPDDLVHSVFSETVYRDHPLGREVLGDAGTITAMGRDQVYRYYKRRYTPDNLVIAIAGNVEHEHVVALVADALEGWQPHEAARARRTAPGPLAEPGVTVRERPTEQAHVLLGGSGFARNDERRHAAHVLNQALGGGMASRLFQEVREKRGLAYSVYSYHSMHADAGTFAVYAGTSPDKADTLVDVIRDELAKARSHGLTDAELSRAKGALAGSMVLALEDTGSRMTRLGKSLITDTPLLSLDETIAAVEAVTHDDIRAVADTLLGGAFALAVVGPFGSSSERRFARSADPLAA